MTDRTSRISIVMCAYTEERWSELVAAVEAVRCRSLSEIVVDGDSGLLVPPGDSTALVTALRRLLADQNLRQKMGQAGKRRAEEFRASAIVPRVEEVYRSVLTKEVSTETQEATL